MALTKEQRKIKEQAQIIEAIRAKYRFLQDQHKSLKDENLDLRKQVNDARDDLFEIMQARNEEATIAATAGRRSSMSGRIVHCDSDTRTILTKETKTGGVVQSINCTLDGDPIQDNGVKYVGTHPDHVEVYLDTLSGEHVAKITASKAAELRAAGEAVYQGVGGVMGWFVDAPDFTLNGRHGASAEPTKKTKAAA
jgi:cell division septum initiation protein DivIVA